MRSFTSLICRRAAMVAGGLLIDRLVSDPPSRYHPVAWFGSSMNKAESMMWKDHRRAGVYYTIAGLVPSLVTAAICAWGSRGHRGVWPTRTTGMGVAPTAVAATILATTLGGRQLCDVSHKIAECLDRGDLDGARRWLPWLVGRDPSQLDESAVAAATIESVGENAVDAVIAPLFWSLAAGVPGAVAYRCINTMDAMVGHHSDRHENFGWASARLDDIANYVPARLWVALVSVVGPASMGTVAHGVRRDASKHPSPNAGPAETAVAYSLDIRLGGPVKYHYREENRPYLGQGNRPCSTDIRRAVKLLERIERSIMLVAGTGFVCSVGIAAIARMRVSR